MAKANTYEWDKIDGYGGIKTCAICGAKSDYRAFYYPTYFNGDATWLGDYCKEHRNTDLEKVLNDEVKLLYKVGDEE